MKVNKSPCLTLLALSLLCVALPARADDTNRWAGSHLGGRIGYGWGNGDTRFTPLPDAATFVNLAPQSQSASPKGALIGIEYGYDWQQQHMLYGFAGDISLSTMSGDKTVTPITQNNGTPFPGAGHVSTHVDGDWLVTARFKLGYAPSAKWMWFGTGGLAYGKMNYSASTDFRPVGTTNYTANLSKSKAGWTLGAGAEYALKSNWSLVFDYRYYDFGKESTTVNAVPLLPPYQVRYEWQSAFHSVNVGVNWKF